MFTTALALLGDRELAAEAVQQAFVQAWRGAGAFDPGRELKPWLYAIVRRAAIDVHRREHRAASHVPLDEAWEEDTRACGADPLEDVWYAWQVRKALAALHPDERLVVELAYFQGYSQSEISAALRIALGTVKSRTARAQRRLAGLLSHLRTQ
ncbi:RNA polymerase sigma-70 factor, ECF subfamily [Thermomonospora echinospora]|uniref:RNA polymerase sigma-70 factor, ECF subfamily n=2 Tax=Thermomonospora echinospora TaxID=1992 RepID=A0A1H6D0C2_9ACTN|nr:RNA polymerase sigma-70 factor, ECF subfamily [Thermomonospora echinospora]